MNAKEVRIALLKSFGWNDSDIQKEVWFDTDRIAQEAIDKMTRPLKAEIERLSQGLKEITRLSSSEGRYARRVALRTLGLSETELDAADAGKEATKEAAIRCLMIGWAGHLDIKDEA